MIMDVPKELRVLHYRRGYKYTLAGNHIFHVSIKPAESIYVGYVHLNVAGVLWMKGGYACDGASGPTIDDKMNMRGAFIHDGICQLIRLGQLPPECKEAADRELQKAIIEDGQVIADRMNSKKVSIHIRSRKWTFSILKPIAAIYMGGVKTRAWYYYQAVSKFGGKSCQPGYDPYPMLYAP